MRCWKNSAATALKKCARALIRCGRHGFKICRWIMWGGALAIPEPPKEQNIVLTGFMSTGKSTVGQRLAELLKRRFVDSDEVIVERAGMTIPQIFVRDGEAGFRALEKEVCGDLAAQHGLVIATGGGML